MDDNDDDGFSFLLESNQSYVSHVVVIYHEDLYSSYSRR